MCRPKVFFHEWAAADKSDQVNKAKAAVDKSDQANKAKALVGKTDQAKAAAGK